MLLRQFLRTARFAVFANWGILLAACGSRTPLPIGDGTFESPCSESEDCRSDNLCESYQCLDGFCRLASKVTCDDTDACTVDTCVAETGQCSFAPSTSDEDGDGYRAIAIGKRLGDVGACGDDCDDTSASALPGGVEVCDGADNDCNGVIDDSAQFQNPSAPVLVSYTAENESIPAGLAYANGGFAMTSVQRDDRWHGYFQTVAFDGSAVTAPKRITPENSDAMAGGLVWTGAVFGTAWEDRRDESYDIYFNRLDASGNKLGPDVRVTENGGFSVSPSLLWDGTSWILAYSDQASGELFRVYMRRLSYEGAPLGEAVPITGTFTDARAPRLIRSDAGLLVLYVAVGEGYRLQRLDDKLMPRGAASTLPLTDVDDVSVRWNRDRFLVAWSTKTETVGSDILAMTMSEAGDTIGAPRVIASGLSMARSTSWVALGDRAYLVWADDHDVRGLFELSGQMFDNELNGLGQRRQLTSLRAETFDPAAVIGGDGIGVVFRSRALGNWQTFFLRLGCATAPL